MTPPLSIVALSIEEAEHPFAHVRLETSLGVVEIVAAFALTDRVLYVTEAHIQGLWPGALGRGGLNAMGRLLLELTDADLLVVEGSDRTTGARPGRRPRPIRFPR